MALPAQLRHFSLLCALFLLLAACSPMTRVPIGNPELPYPPESPPKVGDILHVPTGHYVSAEAMLTAATAARIVYIGETHDNPASHRLQLQVLEAMNAAHPGRVSLGMEMFNHAQQPVLDDWVAGKLTEKEFLKTSDWYSVWAQDFTYYREILNYARDHAIPVVGLNVTKEFRRKVGMTALDELDEETRAQLPEMDFDDPYQRAMAEAVFGGHGAGGPALDGFLRVQTLWDEAMAEAIVAHLTPRGPAQHMVVLAGGNHIRYGYGIPRRVFRRLPVSYTLIGGREIVVPEEKKDRIMDIQMPRFPMAPYDYQAYLAYESLPEERKVKLGVMFDATEEGIRVKQVVPGSAADTAGVLAGDLLLRLDDVPLEESFDLIYEIKQKSAGDRSRLVVGREGEELQLEVEFQPLAEMHGQQQK